MRTHIGLGIGAAFLGSVFFLSSPVMAQSSAGAAGSVGTHRAHPQAAPSTSPSPSPSSSPLLGRWDVDVARLPMPPEARPRRVTISYSAVDAGRWQMDVEIVDNAGQVTHGVSVIPLDGTQVEAKGSPEADRIAAVLPQPDVLVTSLAKGTAPASTRIYAVSADGKTMVETASYFGEGGKSILRTNYFTRAKTP